MLSHSEEITCIEWDVTGSKLVIGDAVGTVQIWGLKDHIISEWILISSHDAFCGERVMTTAWFHNGIKIGINPEKKDLALPYYEKFVNLKFGASVKQFGGKPAEGCFAISSSGLVWSLVLMSDNTTITGSDTLGQFRSKLKVVDVSYAKNGHFLVVTSNGSTEAPVNCYTVNVKISSNPNNQDKSKCTVQCQPFSSFYLNCSSNNETEKYTSITHLKLVLKEAADAVVVATSGASGSSIELWELREKPVIIHKLFPTKPAANGSVDAPPVIPKEVVWQHHASLPYPSVVNSIATPRLSLFDATPPPSYIVVAFRDNTIKCIFRENLQQICSVNVYQGVKGNGSKPFAPQRAQNLALSSTCITDMQFSWSGCALIGIDALSQLFVYRIAPITDPTASVINPSFAQSLFEYCLITGNDPWDILIELRPNLIENVIERLKEGYQKQPHYVQQKHYAKFYELQACLYRCLFSGSSGNHVQCKSGDCYATILLNSVATTLKSLLRQQENKDRDGPAEHLSSLMQSKGNEPIFLIDNILPVLNNKDFFVEAINLQQFQSINQWVADLALYLLASLPLQCHNQFRFPGVSFTDHP